MTRYAFYALVVAGLVWFVVAARSLADPTVPDGPGAGAGADAAGAPAPAPAVVVQVPADSVARLELSQLRRRVRLEHRRYLVAHRRVRQLTRTLAHHSSTREAIDLACAVYGSCQTLWSLARCETGGTFDAHAYNRSGASGLFQFMPGTFNSTPFSSLSIWSPYANALAAGWMLTHGRRGEWVC